MKESRKWEQPEPLWREDTKLKKFDPLEKDATAEVVIVGGGITGITTAYLLAKEGRDVALLEGSELLNGTTGHTTAKITAQHDLIYYELMQHFGKEGALAYYKANDEALRFIRGTVKQNQIDCNLQTEDACIYSTTDNYTRKLDKEYQAYQELGIPCEYKNEVSIDVDVQQALYMKDQSHFHPLKYLSFLLDEFIKNGGKVYENTVAVDVERDPELCVVTKDGHRVSCDNIVSCSHFPFYDGTGFYFARMHADRSYVVAIEPEQEYAGGMYLSVDQPVRSVRKSSYEGKEILLIGGESHRTGEGVDTDFHYRALEEFASETFGIKKKLFQWSAQDLFTLDKVPYIGQITKNKDHIYVATGYKKWGMTSGTAAALLLRDQITGKKNPYTELFSPSRFQADPSLKKFFSNNLNVASHLLEGKSERVGFSHEALKKGEGGVIQYNGERAGAYKDEDGQVYLVDTTCTHMGCEVEWNSGEHSWDCPCHGSRFSIEGDVMEGPAKQPLKRLSIDKDTQETDQPENDMPEPV
ncbi:Glycine/D-amino acid oxidase [Thalassobacillus cyri]|uniref:Glycine/D-amino acid oxidase n=1 Tax=Thalassobacillus cyri TaxID=571932 RepID=A0A1H4DLP4_9BACI|nr:FAD-dependent oxidoreductase [Thalassobacillus cyri]SEA73743.1 Glycine/D-amino acid oxidase [Thalassobacillus cyri]